MLFLFNYFSLTLCQNFLSKMMTKRDIAGYLGVDVQTLRNWRKTRPNLYKTIMLGLEVENIIKESKEHLERLEKLKNQNNYN